MRAASLLLLTVAAQPVPAQTALALIHGTANVTGHSRSPSQGTAFLPDHPAQWSLALTLGSATSISLEVGHSRADLALRGAGTAIVTRDVLHAWTGSIEIGRTIAARRGAAALRAALGPLLERWEFDLGASDARWRASLRASLRLEVVMSAHWKGIVRGELAVGQSLFRAAELPEGYQSRPGWRRGIALGVAWTPTSNP